MLDRPSHRQGSDHARSEQMKKAVQLLETFYSVFVILAAIPIWAAAVSILKVPPYLVPSPLTVWNDIVQYHALLTSNFFVTLRETLMGFCIGVLIGLPLGFGMVLWRPLERTLYPFLIMLESTPKIALAPLLVVWIGLGTPTRVVQACIVVFFPVLISTAVGLRSTSPEMIDMLRSMGASKIQIFSKLQIPSALPSIFGGLKVALPLSVIGAIVAEFVGGSDGLGATLLAAEGAFNTGLLFACIVILALMGVILFRIVETIEWLAIGGGVRWRRSLSQAIRIRRQPAAPQLHKIL
jgi:NitT/TauT family transport system permease protein